MRNLCTQAENSLKCRLFEENFLSDAKSIAEDVISFGTINYFLPNDVDTTLVIDFVFVQDEYFAATKYEVDRSAEYEDKPVSDHYPVIVDLELL